jgi:acyl dehydratase
MAQSTVQEDTRLLMCEENVRVGMKLGPLFYLVMPDQIAAFTRALGDENPLFSPDSPAGAQLAPPTMRLLDYSLLIAQHFRGGSGGIHAKHRLEMCEPMRAGQTVRVEGAITEAYHRRGKFYFVLEYEQRDAESMRLLARHAITAVLLHEGKMQ